MSRKGWSVLVKALRGRRGRRLVRTFGPMLLSLTGFVLMLLYSVHSL